MNIVVCLKVIADPEIIEFDLISNSLSKTHWILDPIGQEVLEQALLLTQKNKGKVTVLSIADHTKSSIIGSTLLLGADRAITAWHDSLNHSDTWQRAAALASCLQDIDYDLVLLGSKSGDSGNQVMACALADQLSLPTACGIIGLKLQRKGLIRLDKKMNKGGRETYKIKAPCVIGLEPGIAKPRYVPLFSKTYRMGESKKLEKIELKLTDLKQARRTMVVRFTQTKPRVKAGINVSALSMMDRMKMIRGELGNGKEVFKGAPDTGAMKIKNELESVLK